jgi:hypothetical protein
MGMKWQRGRIDPKIESDRAANHHDQDEGLGGECRKARPDMGTDEQPAGRASHGKPDPFQKVREFPDAGSHGVTPDGWAKG